MKDTAGKGRLQRGIALADAGGAVLHGDLWVVAGKARNYTVNLDDPIRGATCDCKDWRYRGRDSGQQCYHIIAAQLTESRDRCKRRKRVDRRHKKAESDGLRGTAADADRLDQAAIKLGV